MIAEPDTMKRTPMRRRVVNDMMIGATLLDLLHCPRSDLCLHVHDATMVLQEPHCNRTNGDRGRTNGNHQKQSVVPVHTTLVHTIVGVDSVQGICGSARHFRLDA